MATTGDARETADEAALLDALRAGDAEAYAALVDEHAAAMVRLARTVAVSPSAADDVVRDAWARALAELDRFDGRSPLRTWLFAVLLDVARARVREPAPAAGPGEEAPAVDPGRFRPPGEQWAGGWKAFPEPFPADVLDDAETRERVRAAIEALPEGQRAVLELRDVAGWGPEDVCNVLGLAESDQRALLHRARSAVRQALEDFVT